MVNNHDSGSIDTKCLLWQYNIILSLIKCSDNISSYEHAKLISYS